MSLANFFKEALRPKQQAPTAPLAPTGTSFDSIERDSVELWMGRLGEAMERFSQWLVEHGSDVDFWPSFGELVRSTLNECCGATLVTPYRVADSGRELRAMRDANPLVQTDCISARRGIVGHVLTTGRSYVAGASSHGTLIDSLAGDAEKAISWCFVIPRGTQRLGVVTAGHIAGTCAERPVVLSVAERMIAQFWLMAADAERIRTLEQFDPVCELLSRPAFLKTAQESLRESYHQGAPVAVAVLALEGLRGVNDSGRWEIIDELLREVSKLMRARVRGEDRIGRFDGSRFVILLRCVDSELATLIVRQLIAQLTIVCGDVGRWGATIKVRCGLAGSGTGQPTLRNLVSRALSEAQRAREQNRLIGSDIVEPANGRAEDFSPRGPQESFA
jgi:diguanylate cyclase (GGDEF)-like protein